MFRTFTQNPSLGGFGGESRRSEEATPDAFSQIIKELVDNAVDACAADEASIAQPKRVRVEFEKYGENGDILRVTVSDNGVGMEDIEACVGAFHTSKAQNFHTGTSPTLEGENDAQQTAGRYGIGLTLCLLHAQRLVPNSCASIQSAVRSSQHWCTLIAVVDPDSDQVCCTPREKRRKGSPSESGTAVSVLVPGGDCASQAWPRLAEYFARFRLSLKVRCSLEVLAPTISLVPLFVRPASTANGHEGTKKKRSSESSNSTDFPTNDGWDGIFNKHKKEPTKRNERRAPNLDHQTLQIAAESFLGKKLSLDNVAYQTTPIILEGADKGSKSQKRKNKELGPNLDVGLIVHGLANDVDSYDENGESAVQHDEEGATMMLVRMVNKIPMLDSAEAIACGLVQGLVGKKQLWRSFGLDVSLKPHSADGRTSCSPTYVVRDSEQVASFLKTGTHNIFDPTHENDSGTARQSGHLLPAQIRLGNILVIVGINADPNMLPLPTLSKGRLPIDSKPVKEALEVGVAKCLQQLQENNPLLLLSATELKKAERDTMHIPAAAVSLASILFKATANRNAALDKITSWDAALPETLLQAPCAQPAPRSLADITRSIESRLRSIVTVPQTKLRLDENNEVSEDDDEKSCESLLTISGLPWKTIPCHEAGTAANGDIDDCSSYEDL